MTKRLLERRELPNGVDLEFWDGSRKLAGDRWYVCLRAVLPVPVPEVPPEGVSPAVIQLLREEVGDHLCFQVKEERYFVPENEVDALRDQLKERLLEHSLPYLSRPDFPRRFLMRKLQEVDDTRPRGRDYLERLFAELRRPAPD
jgi:hypothetical protein